jgi:hypothetical protein
MEEYARQREYTVKLSTSRHGKTALAGIKIKILENIGMNELQTESTIGFIGVFGVLIGTILTYFVDKLRLKNPARRRAF